MTCVAQINRSCDHSFDTRNYTHFWKNVAQILRQDATTDLWKGHLRVIKNVVLLIICSFLRSNVTKGRNQERVSQTTEVDQQNSPGVNVAFPSFLLFSASSLDHLPQRVKMEERHSPVGWWDSTRRRRAAASPVIPTPSSSVIFKREGKITVSKSAFYHQGEAKRTTHPLFCAR